MVRRSMVAQSGVMGRKRPAASQMMPADEPDEPWNSAPLRRLRRRQRGTSWASTGARGPWRPSEELGKTRKLSVAPRWWGDFIFLSPAFGGWHRAWNLDYYVKRSFASACVFQR